MAERSVRIPAGMNGPHGSANGGVAAGVMAGLVDGPVSVRLHAPPPLDTPLQVTVVDGAHEARDGDGTLVLSAAPADPADTDAIEVPAVVLDTVGDGAPFPDHPADACVVCGPEHRAGLRVFPAPVTSSPDTTVLATRWTPPAWACTDGVLDEALLWGVLDCPGALAVMHADPEPVFAALGSITGVIHEPVRAGQQVVVLGWTLPPDGRKRPAGTAVLSLDGTVLAATTQLTIAVPPAWAGASG